MDEAIENISTNNTPTESAPVQNVLVQNTPQEPIKKPSKWTNPLKIWLIACASVRVVWWAWAGLTKAWVIPNRFWIEALCPWNMNDTDFYSDSKEIWPYWDITDIGYKESNDKQRNNWFMYNIPNDKQRNYWSVENKTIYKLDKPIIYLYPTEETQVNVVLWTPQNLSHTYPKYNSKRWRNVIAQPNGDLEDMDTWRKLYALYREWKSDNETNFDEWFVVKWEDIIPFLEEKLAILWLNEREAEEFIVYRLPQMENNKYNLIRFETKAEQDENMPLNITPIPDTVIRVMMDWKSIDEPIEIPEQKLVTSERNWFTVVEWWGSPRN